ncbi:hypothetical protein C8J57DRAFT_1276859 [Mycena rebaudengoi]|nr:hypothetical protein C8J57DRAFT_1276859 [Mycena rebaudengoi]
MLPLYQLGVVAGLSLIISPTLPPSAVSTSSLAKIYPLRKDLNLYNSPPPLRRHPRCLPSQKYRSLNETETCEATELLAWYATLPPTPVIELSQVVDPASAFSFISWIVWLFSRAEFWVVFPIVIGLGVWISMKSARLRRFVFDLFMNYYHARSWGPPLLLPAEPTRDADKRDAADGAAVALGPRQLPLPAPVPPFLRPRTPKPSAPRPKTPVRTRPPPVSPAQPPRRYRVEAMPSDSENSTTDSDDGSDDLADDEATLILAGAPVPWAPPRPATPHSLMRRSSVASLRSRRSSVSARAEEEEPETRLPRAQDDQVAAVGNSGQVARRSPTDVPLRPTTPSRIRSRTMSAQGSSGGPHSSLHRPTIEYAQGQGPIHLRRTQAAQHSARSPDDVPLRSRRFSAGAPLGTLTVVESRERIAEVVAATRAAAERLARATAALRAALEGERVLHKRSAEDIRAAKENDDIWVRAAELDRIRDRASSKMGLVPLASRGRN